MNIGKLFGSLYLCFRERKRVTWNRFLYHSFPRRQSEGGSDAKGLEILRLIAQYGLLITPEINKWRDSKLAPSPSEEITQVSKRCCFTELSENELRQHSSYFGDYSIEFEHQALIDLGAVPVIYIPRMSEYDDYGVGPAIITQLAQVMELVSRLKAFKDFAYAAHTANPEADIALSLASNGDILIYAEHTKVPPCVVPKALIDRTFRIDPNFRLPTIPSEGGLIGCNARGLFSFLNMATWGLHNLDVLTHPIRGIASLISSTERKGDALLDHYQQREWRIVGGIVKSAKPITDPVSAQHREQLLRLDPEFFGRMLDLPSGQSPMLDECEVYSRKDTGEPILSLARRIICPSNRIEEIQEILRPFPSVGIATLEGISGNVDTYQPINRV